MRVGFQDSFKLEILEIRETKHSRPSNIRLISRSSLLCLFSMDTPFRIADMTIDGDGDYWMVEATGTEYSQKKP